MIVKTGRCFLPLCFYILPKLSCLSVSEINQTEILNIVVSIWHIEAATVEKALNRFNICPKYGVALRLDVDLQAVEK